jgi:hypothetical protein
MGRQGVACIDLVLYTERPSRAVRGEPVLSVSAMRGRDDTAQKEGDR